MRTRISAALVLAGALLAAPAMAQQTIRFATEATYPPYEFVQPNGEIAGLDIDLAQAMCAEMKVKCTFTNQAWDGIIPGLLAKKYDVIAAAMTITSEREKTILFSKPLWTDKIAYVGKAGTKLGTGPEAFKGKNIGSQQGSTQDKYITKHHTNANIKRYKSFEDAFGDLIAGRLDLVFVDAPVADDFLKSPRGKGMAIVGQLMPSADHDVLGKGKGFAFRKSDAALAERFNKAFDVIKANGTAKKISEKYLKRDIFSVK